MKIYDDSNYHELTGDGKVVIQNGEQRLLSAVPKPPGHDSRVYSKALSDFTPTFARSEWRPRLQEQTAKKRRVSDFQNFDADDQNGKPICWSAGTVHAASTARVIQGLPFVRLSAASVAVPISGGNSGGYEGDAVRFLTKYGAATVEEWPYHLARDLSDKPEVQESRKHHMALEVYECEGFDQFATALLLGFPCTVSYNWWSHVVSLADLVEIESGSWGVRIRNNWGEWQDKNDLGFSGYAVFREGKGTPSGGFAFRQVTASVK